MKHLTMKSILIATLALSAQLAFAQEGFRGEHFIEVTGTAEQEIEPNEIYVVARVREFENNRQKIALEKLDQDFVKAVTDAGIDKKRLEIADAGMSLQSINKKEKDAFRSKTYQLKLTSAAELDKLLRKLQNVEVDYFDVVRVHHTDYEKMKLDLKIKALQVAKAKADALLKGIGSEVGKPLMVREWDVQPQPYMDLKANMVVRSEMGTPSEEQAPAFKKIKLQMQVVAQFEIK